MCETFDHHCTVCPVVFELFAWNHSTKLCNELLYVHFDSKSPLFFRACYLSQALLQTQHWQKVGSLCDNIHRGLEGWTFRPSSPYIILVVFTWVESTCFITLHNPTPALMNSLNSCLLMYTTGDIHEYMFTLQIQHEMTKSKKCCSPRGGSFMLKVVRGRPLMIWGGQRINRKWIHFFCGNAFWELFFSWTRAPEIFFLNFLQTSPQIINGRPLTIFEMVD